MSKGKSVQKTSEVLQETLDLMILKTLHAIGPLHGFGIARFDDERTTVGGTVAADDSGAYDRILGLVERERQVAAAVCRARIWDAVFGFVRAECSGTANQRGPQCASLLRITEGRHFAVHISDRPSGRLAAMDDLARIQSASRRTRARTRVAQSPHRPYASPTSDWATFR